MEILEARSGRLGPRKKGQGGRGLGLNEAFVHEVSQWTSRNWAYYRSGGRLRLPPQVKELLQVKCVLNLAS